MKKVKNLLIIALAACLILAGCGPKEEARTTDSGNGEPSRENNAADIQQSDVSDRKLKDTLTVVLKGEPSNIDPHGNTELVAFTTQMQIFDNLVKKDEQGNILPELATKWEVVDDLTIRFYLRDDVYFHNGEKLTAEDVRYSIERATEKPSSAAIFKSFDGANTKVVDDYTIDIKTKAPFAGIYNYLCSSRGGIVCKKAVEEMGDAEYGRNPVGSGAFKFVSWDTGTDIKLERNDDYWGDKPKFKNMVLKFITETANRAIELESGGADIIFDPDPTDIERLDSNEDLKVVSGPSYGMSYVVFNMNNKPLDDVKVREALTYALDKEILIESVYGNMAEPADSVIPSTIFAYKSIGSYPYDPDKAKELLKEAGYGEGLSITMSVPNTKEFQDIAEIVQNMWRNVGAQTEIQTSDLSSILATMRRGEAQSAVMSASSSTGDPGHAFSDFDSRGDNLYQVNDDKVNEYLDKGAIAYSEEERLQIYGDAQQYVYDLHNVIPLAFKKVAYAMTNNVENFYCDPGNCPYLGDVTVYE